jgi:hypothetical protein
MSFLKKMINIFSSRNKTQDQASPGYSASSRSQVSTPQSVSEYQSPRNVETDPRDFLEKKPGAGTSHEVISNRIKKGRIVLFDQLNRVKEAFTFNKIIKRQIAEIKTEQDYAKFAMHVFMPQSLKLREVGFFNEDIIANFNLLYNKYAQVVNLPKAADNESKQKEIMQKQRKTIAVLKRKIVTLTDQQEKLLEKIKLLNQAKKNNREQAEEIARLEAKVSSLETILQNLIEEQPEQEKILEINTQLLEENFNIKRALHDQHSQTTKLVDQFRNSGSMEQSLLDQMVRNLELYKEFENTDDNKQIILKNKLGVGHDFNEIEYKLSEMNKLSQLAESRQSIIEKLANIQEEDKRDEISYKLAQENEQLVNLLDANKELIESVENKGFSGLKNVKILCELREKNSMLEKKYKKQEELNEDLLAMNNKLLAENKKVMSLYNKFKSRVGDYENSIRFFEQNEREYFDLKKELAAANQKNEALQNQYINLSKKYSRVLHRYQELVHEYDALFNQLGIKN